MAWTATAEGTVVARGHCGGRVGGGGRAAGRAAAGLAAEGAEAKVAVGVADRGSSPLPGEGGVTAASVLCCG